MARYENGWIKVHRRAVIEDIGDNVICLGLWVTFLALATWKESKIMWEGQQRVLPPGSVLYGMNEFAERWGVSKSTVKRWVEYLVKTERIRNESGTRGSLATICNWEKYQALENEAEREQNADGTPTERRQNADGTPSVTYEEGKKVRIEEGKKELLPAAPSASSVATWEAYRSAYQKRYGVPPVRNASVNSQLKNLVKRLGEEEAPLIAEFYLSHNDAFYIKCCHAVGPLLRDSEKLRTEWATGRKILGTQARDMERMQYNADVFSRAAERMEKRNGGSNG